MTPARAARRSAVFPFWIALPLAIAALLSAPGPARPDGHTITAHGISVFGELRYPAGFPHFDYVNPDAPQGGTMRFFGTLAINTFDSLNPYILKGNAAQGLGRMYDSLLAASADEEASAYGLVAETLEYPEDRSWVIFNMRPEATFSDGEPIGASDVVFSHRILVDEGHPAYPIQYQDIESVEALDAHRVRFTFAEGASKRELIQLAGSIPILPEHYWADKDFAESTLTPPVGSGGYLVEDADPGRSITYCKNPDYWAWDHPIKVGANNFDCIVYEYFADRTAGFEAFKGGGYLLHESYASKEWATAYDFPAIDRGWVIREELKDNRPSGTQGFWINLRRDKFQDPRVREAVGTMFNFEFSNETLFYGIYKRTDSFWENTQAMQASGLPEGEELEILEEFRADLPETVFTEAAFTPVVNEPGGINRRVIRRAAALLEEAGWTLQDGMRKNAAGQTLTIDIVDDSPVFERVINPYVENLRRLGIDARLVLVDPAQMEERQRARDYDIIPARLLLSLTPGLELRQFYSTASAEAADTLNLSGIADPAIDTLIERIAGAETRESLEAHVRALDRILRDRHIWVPNWYKGTHQIAYWDVFGRPDTKPDFARGDAYWWWDQEKYDALKAAGAPLP
ncbi:MAG: extracellular solute-binding protein [Pseudomonadota bacterium]